MTSVQVDKSECVPVDVSKKSSEDVNKIMLEYWERWAGDITESGTSLEIMVGEAQHSRATQISELEKREIFSFLPDMTNMKVLELAAGTG